jgi:transcriptional regulator with XRE-family HTH domain
VTLAPWADRLRAARKAAGFTSAGKLAVAVGASERTVIRWETGEGFPSEFRVKLAAISPELADLMEELPAEADAPFAERLDQVERRLGEVETSVTNLVKAVEDTLHELVQLEHALVQLEQQYAKRGLWRK